MTRRELEALVGILNFTATFIPLGRLHLLQQICWMKAYTSTGSRDSLVPLDNGLKNLLEIWISPPFLNSLFPMGFPEP